MIMIIFMKGEVMKAYFYNLPKAPNVYKKSISGATTKHFNLLQGSSVLNPRLELKDDGKTYNYVWIEQFNRYYHVEDVVHFPNDIVVYTLTADNLQNAVNEMKERGCKVQYKRTPLSANWWKCFDSEVPCTGDFITGETRWGLFPTDGGKFIINVIAGGGNTFTPNQKTYICTASGLQYIIRKVFMPETYGMSGAMDIATQTICNPMQYVNGIKYAMISPPLKSPDPVTTIDFGWSHIQNPDGELIWEMDDSFAYGTMYKAIGKQAKSNDAVTTYNLEVPMFGFVDIPASILVKGLHATLHWDYATGDASLKLYLDDTVTTDEGLYQELKGNIYIDIAYNGISNVINSSTFSSIGGFLEGSLTSIFSSLAGLQDIEDTLTNAFTTRQPISKGGGTNYIYNKDRLDLVLHSKTNVYDTDFHTVYGYADNRVSDSPLMTEGYYRTADIKYQSDTLLAQEVNSAKAIMNSGFYVIA